MRVRNIQSGQCGQVVRVHFGPYEYHSGKPNCGVPIDPPLIVCLVQIDSSPFWWTMDAHHFSRYWEKISDGH